MTDRRAFLEAIKAAPEDDAPKLIWADWLDEHDESDRADMIRRLLVHPRRNAEIRELINVELPNVRKFLVPFWQDELAITPDRAIADVLRVMPWEFYFGALWSKFEVKDVMMRFWEVTVFYEAPVFA